jgi:hypothetical protein
LARVRRCSTQSWTKFPEAAGTRSTARRAETALAAAIRREVQGQAGEHRARRRIAGAAEERRPCVYQSAARPRDRGAIVRELSGIARKLGHPVTEVPVDAVLRPRSGGDDCRVEGSGLIFFNNPNNPTATVHGAKAVADFVSRVRKLSPDTMILIDEAYHDYVTDAAYQTAIPLALDTPNVFVTRTFSKAYGMAGMRVGYAIGRSETMKPLATLKMPYNVSVLGIAAAMAAMGDTKHIEAERARNTDVRAFT